MMTHSCRVWHGMLFRKRRYIQWLNQDAAFYAVNAIIGSR